MHLSPGATGHSVLDFLANNGPIANDGVSVQLDDEVGGTSTQQLWGRDGSGGLCKEKGNRWNSHTSLGFRLHSTSHQIKSPKALCLSRLLQPSNIQPYHHFRTSKIPRLRGTESTHLTPWSDSSIVPLQIAKSWPCRSDCKPSCQLTHVNCSTARLPQGQRFWDSDTTRFWYLPNKIPLIQTLVLPLGQTSAPPGKPRPCPSSGPAL